MTRVKICGITGEADALAAARAGAHALGFVFAPSRRRVTPDQARDIIRSLPPLIMTVGVFVDSSEDEVRETAHYCGLDLVQLHGQETPEFCSKFPGRVVKALRMDRNLDMEEVQAFQETTRALLVDSGAGGTGHVFDWKNLPPEIDRDRLILAGGLNPENVFQAIQIIKPWAVDVSTGVESAPGKKDEQKMTEFTAKVREADDAIE